jgi:hypothetical protein
MKKLAIALVALAIPAAAFGASSPSKVTISAHPSTVKYNASSALSGTTTPATPNAKVQIQSRECGQSSFSPLSGANTTTASNGTYKTTVSVYMKTAYTAKVKSTTSSSTTVLVRPRVALKKLAAHRYRVRVRAAKSFAGKTATFQRWSTSLGKWVKLRNVTLKFIKNGIAPTIISGASFNSSVAAGKKVRATLPAKQAAPCYIAGKSKSILS